MEPNEALVRHQKTGDGDTSHESLWRSEAPSKTDSKWSEKRCLRKTLRLGEGFTYSNLVVPFLLGTSSRVGKEEGENNFTSEENPGIPFMRGEPSLLGRCFDKWLGVEMEPQRSERVTESLLNGVSP